MSDFLNLGAVANLRQKHGEFVASQPGQHIHAAQLVLHAQRNFLQVQISDLVAVNIVDLLESVKIHIDQSEDAGLLASLFNQLIQTLVQREAIVYVGQQVKLRASQQIGVEASGLNSQRGEPNRHGQSLRLVGAGEIGRASCRE